MKKSNLKNTSLLAASLLFLSGISCSEMVEIKEEPEASTPVNLVVEGPWATVFSEEFNQGFSKWERTDRYDYNSEGICYYDPSIPNLVNRDGRSVLELEARKEGAQYTSGHVKSYYSFTPAVNEEYRVVATIKVLAKNGSTFAGFASTYGAWPAFWTVDESVWPTHGEIDIFEMYSKNAATEIKSNLFYGTSVGNDILGNEFERRYTGASASTSGWHEYEMRWKNTNGVRVIKIYKDGVYLTDYSNSQSYNGLNLNNFEDHNVILNLNVGDNGGIFTESLISITGTNTVLMWVDNVSVEKRTLNN